MENKNTPLSEVEQIKLKSNYLRGTIKESLIDELTGAIAPDDTQLIKFHGTYQQTDRDLESERKKQKLEPFYSFMIRVRMPGGIATPGQWQVMDDLADKYGSGTLKLTTRQTFQLHGVLKRNLKKTIAGINESLFDTIAACGDVNRNVMCNPNPDLSFAHRTITEDARAVGSHLLPKTTAYHEIWLEKKLVAGGQEDEEPVYGKSYLPRKFKIAFAVPPNNDVDVLTNDLGFIAIVENSEVTGYNISVGGGMGMTFGNKATYPRLANIIGYVSREKFIEVAEQVVKIQRDNGNRQDRKNARLKYTIDRMGLDQFKKELIRRLAWEPEPVKPFEFTSTGDEFGWRKTMDNLWNLTLFIEGGRVLDKSDYKLKTALRKISSVHKGEFRLTGNQNLVIAGVAASDKKLIESILNDHGIIPGSGHTGLRLNSIACVALNTCPLAFADAERYLPSLIDKLDVIIRRLGLEKEAITIRMTGCPNGCGRPYNAEIGFVGRAKGIYNLYLGGGFEGNRLNTLYKEMLNEQQILETLDPILTDYASQRKQGEHFGDFVHRKGIV